MNLRDKITSQFSQLSPQLQHAAEFSLQNANQLVVESMRTFAVSAGVQPATLMRLAQRLGFPGWGDLKNAFIDELGLRNDTYVSRAEKLVNSETKQDLYHEVFNAQASNLEHTKVENHAAMQQAVELLDNARHVYICGYRASFPIAWSLFYVYRLFNPRVTLIDGLASGSEIYSRELTADDCVLIASFSPYSREVLKLVNAAVKAGSKIIAITDSPVSPVAQKAACSLYFNTDGPSFFPSIVSGMGIAECLLALLVAKHGQQAVARIENAEHYLIDSGAYVISRKQRSE
ncbi:MULTISPECIES: MurR/RpiR family transcriptional regulator [Pantoea]|uniref:MurR/RpiR family transcriptional regulator n=1 Tax=Candidatus Pantoea multigeneris TaxID=2608357 RepID=A0ABX0RDM1_9GAMM|nr:MULTISPECIES: MurR/RpiR family transcriptional regulator [Pantoea]NIF22248.1 MurR/RpiR family transcriptional regulator [Pantoea multigeneris]